MIIFPRKKFIQDCIFTGTWTKKEIPVYTVTSMNGLNQLVGYVKHINASNGTVLYRGQCELYPSMKASICRNPKTYSDDVQRLENIINVAIQDDGLKNIFNFNDNFVKGWTLFQSLAIEAAMQHYGAKTFCMDFVDNHWTALWFGLYKWDKTLGHYTKRTSLKDVEEDNEIIIDEAVKEKPLPPKPILDTDANLSTKEMEIAHNFSIKSGKPEVYFIKRTVDKRNKRKLNKWKKQCEKIESNNANIPTKYAKDNLIGHMYLFLYVADTDCPTLKGVSFGKDTYTMDLRKTLPSVFLRPSSQHGWVVKGCSNDYDFDSGIVCVIRINVDLVADMLGNGSLLSVENFFPSSKYDQGYHVLLERQEGTSIPSALPFIFPANTIDSSF